MGDGFCLCSVVFEHIALLLEHAASLQRRPVCISVIEEDIKIITLQGKRDTNGSQNLRELPQRWVAFGPAGIT
jgi:hypothetical protein